MKKEYLLRFLQLQSGLFLYGLGIVFCIQANIGYAPWDIFHVGISKITGISVGTASISVGFVVLAIVIFLKEPLGIGTIFNMIMIGIWIDVISGMNIIALSHTFLIGLLMLLTGLFIISVAMVFYIKSGFGAGPRDSAMVAFHRKTGFSVAFTKGVIETAVAFAGWRMGGMLGIGTLISAFFSGLITQFTFRLFRFDVKTVRHENLRETFAYLRRILK